MSRQGKIQMYAFIAVVSLITTKSLGGQEIQAVSVVRVIAKNIASVIQLPGELLPYQSVFLHARVSGYIEEINVDRGSQVKKDQLLVKLSAPELKAQVAEAESMAEAAESQKVEAVAHLASAQST